MGDGVARGGEVLAGAGSGVARTQQRRPEKQGEKRHGERKMSAHEFDP